MERIIAYLITKVLREYIAFKTFKKSDIMKHYDFVRTVKLGNPQLYKDIMEELEQ